LSRNSWIVFIIISVGILVSLVVFSGSSKIDVSKVDTNVVQKEKTKNVQIPDHVFGNPNSKVILFEYGDFQCPPCASVHPTIKSITEQYKDQMQFVFRNFPIPESHPNAKAAAGSAEAASLQGKYWEMHNKIYETQTDWSELSTTDRTIFFEKLASEIGLDIKKFNTDLSSPDISEKINYDTALGKKAGVDGTPTFFLNGKKLDSKAFASEAKFKELINAELKKAGVPSP